MKTSRGFCACMQPQLAGDFGDGDIVLLIDGPGHRRLAFAVGGEIVVKQNLLAWYVIIARPVDFNSIGRLGVKERGGEEAKQTTASYQKCFVHASVPI